ncbi:MAG: helix-turn-helix transcriptional regulator [Eubacterium sp.]|nr:helix-turn-helix transcriptional regulator [Eubacterium sp.]
MSKYPNTITQLTPDLLREIGGRIKETRNEKGVSIRSLAYSLGVTDRTIYRIEGGEVALDHIKLRIISEELSVSADYLLFGETTKLNNYMDPNGIFSRLDYKEMREMEAAAEMRYPKKAGDYTAMKWMISHTAGLTPEKSPG